MKRLIRRPLAFRLLDTYRYVRVRLPRRLNANAVINGVSDLLFATQVALGGLDGHVPEEELDLFQFAAGKVTEAGARTAIVRRKPVNPDSFREILNHVRNNLFRQPVSPDDPALIDGSE